MAEAPVPGKSGVQFVRERIEGIAAVLDSDRDGDAIAKAVTELEAVASQLREEVMGDVNRGADLVVHDGDEWSDDRSNMANVVTCAIGTLIDKPDATLEDVFRASFEAEQWDQWQSEFPVTVARLKAGATYRVEVSGDWLVRAQEAMAGDSGSNDGEHDALVEIVDMVEAAEPIGGDDE